MLKSLALAFFTFVPAMCLAGPHVSSLALPLDSAPISNLQVTDVNYGKVVIASKWDDSCGYDSCPPVLTYATRVRVTVSYLSPQGAFLDTLETNPNAVGPVELHFDFDPLEFSRDELNRIAGTTGHSQSMEQTLAEVFTSDTLTQISIIDQPNSDDCRLAQEQSEENSSDVPCTPHFAFLNVLRNVTTLTVKLNL